MMLICGLLSKLTAVLRPTISREKSVFHPIQLCLVGNFNGITEPSNVAGSGCGRGFTDKGAGSCTGQGQIAIYLKLYISEL